MPQWTIGRCKRAAACGTLNLRSKDGHSAAPKRRDSAAQGNALDCESAIIIVALRGRDSVGGTEPRAKLLAFIGPNDRRASLGRAGESHPVGVP